MSGKVELCSTLVLKWQHSSFSDSECVSRVCSETERLAHLQPAVKHLDVLRWLPHSDEQTCEEEEEAEKDDHVFLCFLTLTVFKKSTFSSPCVHCLTTEYSAQLQSISAVSSRRVSLRWGPGAAAEILFLQPFFPLLLPS